jgi:hypothetical protein
MKTVLDNVTYSLRKAVVDSHPGETWNRTRGFRRREVRNALSLESLSLSLSVIRQRTSVQSMHCKYAGVTVPSYIDVI